MTGTTTRQIIAGAAPKPEPGSGILRPFPSAELDGVDPFVFLDTGAPVRLDGDIYVGPHAHRGIQAVGILYRGRIEHRDSLGNDRTVTSGGMQWLVSGSGALHEEILHGDEDGIFHMSQLWVNLPDRLASDPPEHHAVGAEDVPALDQFGDGTLVNLYAGTLGSHTGPAPMPTPVLIAHVVCAAGAACTIPIPPSFNCAITCVAGSIVTDHGGTLESGGTAVYDRTGDAIAVSSPDGGQFQLMAGEPLDEPVVMGGGFVVTSAADLEEAFGDYRGGRFGRLSPSR